MLARDIVDYAASLFGITADDLKRDRRDRTVVKARFALYLGLYRRAQRRGLRPVWSDIGRCVNRDRTTVMVGVKRAERMAEEDEAFRNAVLKIVELNETIFQEYTCNRRLQPVQEQDQQTEERPMDNPEYTEERINTALAKAKRPDIQIFWNGDIVTAEDPAFFDVVAGGDDVPFYVTDLGHYFAIQTQPRPGHVETYAEARTFEEAAQELIAVLTTEEA